MTKLQRNKVEIPVSSVYSKLETDSLKRVFIESAILIRADIIETTQTNLLETLTELIKEIPRQKVLSSIERGNTKLDDWLQVNTTKWNPALGSQNIQHAEQATIGLTYCDHALAESGTVVLLNENNKGRSVSLLPEIHVVLIPTKSIIPRLQESMTMLSERIKQGQPIPTCINFITGPSNSADIESYLVVGVHGPLRTIYVIIDEDI
ncbi:LutC/YkgG family protein [Psychrobacillus psychrotolerans]|uniref:LutC/YkgG family protein n=1 Tax=Psychrobacillus psychrotolerans TaxID=126156 RepID=UPI003315700A